MRVQQPLIDRARRLTPVLPLLPLLLLLYHRRKEHDEILAAVRGDHEHELTRVRAGGSEREAGLNEQIAELTRAQQAAQERIGELEASLEAATTRLSAREQAVEALEAQHAQLETEHRYDQSVVRSHLRAACYTTDSLGPASLAWLSGLHCSKQAHSGSVPLSLRKS